MALGCLCVLGLGVLGVCFCLTRGSRYLLAGKHGNLNSKDVAELGWDEITQCKVTFIFSVLSSFEGYN